jgi:hypothetical protein
MVEELPIIHYNLGLPVTAKPTVRCPTNSIIWLDGGQFLESSSAERENKKRYAQLS